MLKESIARRYSAALFSLAKDSHSEEAVTDEIDAFAALLAREPELRSFFLSPVVDRVEKARMLKEALHSRAGELVMNFILLLVRKRRENLLPMIGPQMHEFLDKLAGRETAALATPTPLSPDELASLTQRLSQLYDRTIVAETKVSPELIGGMVMQIGDRYVDASVSGKLEELRRHLLESADTWTETSPNGKGTTHDQR
jgi:F-type H+-transporting ATPase subunit delta